MNKFLIRLILFFIVLANQIHAAQILSLKDLCVKAGAKVSDEILLQNLDRIPDDCLRPVLIQKISFLESLVSFSEPPLMGVEKIYAVAMTADGSKGLSGGAWDNDVTVWDLRNKKVIGRLKGHTGDVESLAITPDGSRGLSGSNDKTMKIWNLDTMENIGTLAIGNPVHSVAMSADGKKGLSASGNGIKLWDLDTMQEINLDTLSPENTKRAIAVAINEDGTRAISGSWDGILRIWDFAAMKVTSIETHRVRSVAINAEGTIGLSGSVVRDVSIKLWDLVSMAEIATLAQLPWGYVHSLAMTPDGTLGISGSSDAIRIWDLVARKEISSLGIHAHSRDVSSVAISANGSIGLSGSWDGTLRLWDLRPLLIKYLPLDFLKKVYIWLYKDKKNKDEVYQLIVKKFKEIEEMQKLPIPVRELVEKKIEQEIAKELKGKAISRRKLLPEKPTGLFELPGVKKPEPVSKRRPPYKQPGLYEILEFFPKIEESKKDE